MVSCRRTRTYFSYSWTLTQLSVMCKKQKSLLLCCNNSNVELPPSCQVCQVCQGCRAKTKPPSYYIIIIFRPPSDYTIILTVYHFGRIRDILLDIFGKQDSYFTFSILFVFHIINYVYIYYVVMHMSSGRLSLLNLI